MFNLLNEIVFTDTVVLTSKDGPKDHRDGHGPFGFEIVPEVAPDSQGPPQEMKHHHG